MYAGALPIIHRELVAALTRPVPTVLLELIDY
jgi:hypothetical protein